MAPQSSAQPGVAGTEQSAASPSIPNNVRLVQTRTSLLGTHKWYRQVKGGRIVVGAWYARHIDRQGNVTIWDGRRRIAKVLPTTARVRAERAAVTAANAADAPVKRADVGMLMVLPPRHPSVNGGTAADQRIVGRLVWPVHTATGAGASTAYVDAATGQILKTIVSSNKQSRAATDTTATTDGVTGRGRVFDPNPVVKLQDESLRDHHDSSTAVPHAAYTVVDLPHLNGSHSLTGRWVRIVNPRIATSSTDQYFFTRANDRFEQVDAYHAVDAEQAYLQSLGFTDVNAEDERVEVNAFPDDNSYYDSTTDKISFGRGGVDDAEDPEVVWHEYGHAIRATR